MLTRWFITVLTIAGVLAWPTVWRPEGASAGHGAECVQTADSCVCCEAPSDCGCCLLMSVTPSAPRCPCGPGGPGAPRPDPMVSQGRTVVRVATRVTARADGRLWTSLIREPLRVAALKPAAVRAQPVEHVTPARSVLGVWLT